MIWILLGLIAALLAVALIRAMACKAAPAPQPEENLPQDLADSYARKLGDMIRIPTVSKAEDEDLSLFYQYHRELEKLFPLVHEKLEKTVLQGTLLYRWAGENKDALPILLMGHQDVVPANDKGWQVGAYSGAVIDGKVFGRGALDCKSTMFVELQTVEELLG